VVTMHQRNIAGAQMQVLENKKVVFAVVVILDGRTADRGHPSIQSSIQQFIHPSIQPSMTPFIHSSIRASIHSFSEFLAKTNFS